MQVKKYPKSLGSYMEQWTGSKLGKGYEKTVHCHPVHLIYMQNTSGEMPDWLKPKLESRLQGEMSITSDMQICTTLIAESEEEQKSLFIKVKEESEKPGLKLNIQKTKMASSPITSWEIDGETVETVSDFIFWAPKSLQMVTAAMKLKDTYSLEEKL